MKHKFIDIVQNTRGVFIGHYDLENYLEIQYVGWVQKGLSNYRITIYRDECGCIYDKILRFRNISEAKEFAVKTIKNG